MEKFYFKYYNITVFAVFFLKEMQSCWTQETSFKKSFEMDIQTIKLFWKTSSKI